MGLCTSLLTFTKKRSFHRTLKICLNLPKHLKTFIILCYRGKIKILKYKSINNVKKVNNTLHAWKVNDIWWLRLECEYSV